MQALTCMIRRIIPAYAGSTNAAFILALYERDHPRLRGEHFGVADSDDVIYGIIPAYAGSTPQQMPPQQQYGDHPRLRGEHALFSDVPMRASGSSPLTRGAPNYASAELRCAGIIPAYAGSTCDPLPPGVPSWDHPRLRGEHTRGDTRARARRGSSPLTRGAQDFIDSLIESDGIIPAYAGSTEDASDTHTLAEDHPRLRGEHPHGVTKYHHGTGSSPLTRGARESFLRSYPCNRDHPRLRGEHRIMSRAIKFAMGSSPLTRGARLCGVLVVGYVRIIPAYAGSTITPPPLLCRTWDHPRLRGEHVPVRQDVRTSEGSSPLTRGAPGHARRGWRAVGIIPAYAGSTP